MFLGRHRLEFPVPDLTRVYLHGNVTPEEAAGILEVDRQIQASHGYSLMLVDMTDAEQISPETRQRAGQVMRENTDYRGAGAILGSSMQMHLLASFMIRAVALILRKPLRIRFFKNESDALLWLEQFRKEFLDEDRER